jgi:hypothetical protein
MVAREGARGIEMTTRRRLLALMLVACFVESGTATVAAASLGKTPRLETDCLRSRLVLRPRFGSSLEDLRPGERMPLVQVRVCNHARRTCMAFGEEVPFSRCSPADLQPETIGNLTTE